MREGGRGEGGGGGREEKGWRVGNTECMCGMLSTIIT